MHLDTVPFLLQPCSLNRSDYDLFAFKFRKLILAQVPTSREVHFINKEEFLQVPLRLNQQQRKRLAAGIFSKKRPQCIEPDTLVFPFSVAERENFAALVGGVDAVIIKRASAEWLAELGAAIEQEMLRVKSQGVDSITGLYNVGLFNDLITGIGWQRDYHIVLVDGLPTARSVKDTINQVVQTSRLLEEYNRFAFPLFHLGQSVFAYLIVDRGHDYLKTFCLSLAGFLRNSGARRIHIGFSSYAKGRHGTNLSPGLYQVIVEEAWEALQRAGKRGPFGFCDYDLVANPDHFPERPVSRSTRARLYYRVKDMERFSLVALKPEFKDRPACDAVVVAYLKKENYIIEPRNYLIILENKSQAAAKKWAQSLIRKIKEDHDEGYLLSAGISTYPLDNFSRTDTAQNCQKALLHATFLDSGSTVICDALSFNVSGDAYYGEGDLSGAVREYRRGLRIDCDDVNLLNSLGVTYALMNRTSEALGAFQRVIAIDDTNFMAWYNKGLGEQAGGDYKAAVASYRQAQQNFNCKDQDEVAVISELRYQLGVSYFHTQAYDHCIETLKKWYRGQTNQVHRGRCCRFIGISYYHLGNHAQASKWLQRGLSFNESDAESLSLLGELYLAGNEGDDIALRLCEKSVELEPDNVQLLLRYARGLAACGRDSDALEVLKRCARSKIIRFEAWLEMAEIYTRQKDRIRGRLYVNKILAAAHVDEAVRQRARRMFAGMD